jgi:RimJ/RimL family protein N-acetyltransferase
MKKVKKKGLMKPVHGNLIDLYPLASEHINSYLHHYSSLVQTILHVSDRTQEMYYLQLKIKEEAFFYGIAQKASSTIIGAIEIRNPVYRSQLYCWLNEQYWGNGYFQEAIQLAANEYFQQSTYSSITARVDCKNRRSVAALKKAGFQGQKVVPGAYGMQIELILKKVS